MVESIWPIEIKLSSLPSAVFMVIFLWNGLGYILFYKFPWQRRVLNAKYLFFGLTSFFLACYSFSTFNLYSANSFYAGLFWHKIQFFAVIPAFIFFNLFSIYFLKLKSYYLLFIVPVVTAFFLPFIFIDEIFLLLKMAPKHFQVFGYSFSVLEAALGPLGIVFMIWGLLNLIILGYYWFLAYFKDHLGFLLPTASIIFLLSTLNDLMVTVRIYSFVYLLELGSFISVVAMAVYLFKEYVNTSKSFYEQKNRLQSANQEIRFLVNAISHDFSAPLLSINGFIGLINSKENLAKKELEHYLRRIEVNSEHIQTLLQDLAAYLQVGQSEVEKNNINLKDLLEEIKIVLGLAENYPGAELKLISELESFKGSKKKLKQVLLNLVQNSLKYSTKDNVFIKVEVISHEKFLRFCISDNGPGIPPEIRNKIFEAFFRNHAYPMGSGLGLAIVKKIIDSFDEKIWVDSKYSSGARVCFTWPKD